MNRTLGNLVVSLALALVVAPLGAAAAHAASPAEGGDPFAGRLFAPELIIKHQTAIGLSAEQRRSLIAEVTQAQADFLPAQMEMAELAEKLMGLLDGTRIDEAAALAVASQVMELESRIKRRHLELAIRIKNLLDESQQARLAELRDQG